MQFTSFRTSHTYKYTKGANDTIIALHFLYLLGKQVFGKITLKHVYEIAKIKHQDSPLQDLSLQDVCKQIIGTCRSVGVQIVRDLDPEEYKQFLEEVAETRKALDEKRALDRLSWETSKLCLFSVMLKELKSHQSNMPGFFHRAQESGEYTMLTHVGVQHVYG